MTMNKLVENVVVVAVMVVVVVVCSSGCTTLFTQAFVVPFSTSSTTSAPRRQRLVAEEGRRRCRRSQPSSYQQGPFSSSSSRSVGSSSRLYASQPSRQPAGESDQTQTQSNCDILVLGSGPAACAIASLLCQDDYKVIIADQNFDRDWVPNYGAWKDEWEAVVERYSERGVQMEGGNCGKGVDREWALTDCFFGGSFDIPAEQRLRLERPYVRLDRFAIKESLLQSLSTNKNIQVLKANHQSTAIGVNLYSPADSLVHDEDGTTLRLLTKDGSFQTVRSKLVVDCTGHESNLVLKETRDPYTSPGFQIAYGILVDVEEEESSSSKMIGPYDKEAMTLFDYRTDHFTDNPVATSKAEAAPTFMYAMPLKDNQIFFEETSLVARPALSFQECKDRCMERLSFHSIRVTKVYEEEFCYIPMGGALPMKEQRIIALGGSAAMVHPATGYHACRMFMGAADVARAITRELQSSRPNLDRAAASAYHALWSPDNVRQRNFAVFGGEFLMKQNVVGLRGFFDGFFRLPLAQWGGFLAGWPGLPNNEKHETWIARILFGLNFIVKLPPIVALDMLSSIVTYSLSEGTALLQSVTPLFGQPSSFEYRRNEDRVGDVAAKLEAKRMIKESTVTELLPVAFEGDSNNKKDNNNNNSDSSSSSSSSKPTSSTTTTTNPAVVESFQ